MKTTLEQAARWVADALGLDWATDRDAAVQRVNDIRELIYDRSTLPWTITLCAPIRCFCGECADCGQYNGISLPAYVGSVLGVYLPAGIPVPMVDRWGIYPHDVAANAPTLRFVDQGEDYPFLNDPPCGECYKLSLLAKNHSDIGKVVVLRYLDANGVDREESITLANLPVTTNYWIKSMARSGVSLPINLAGAVSARTTTGTILSEWQKWELVPGYRRFRVQGAACGSTVIVHIERRRWPLTNLTDPVETDSKLVWEDGAKYLHLHNRTTGDQQDLANEQKFLQSFLAKIEDASRRQSGRVNKRSVDFVSLTPRRSGLMRGRR